MALVESLKGKRLSLAVLGTAKSGYIGLADENGNVLVKADIGPLAYRVNPDFNKDIADVVQNFALRIAGFASLTEFFGALDFACFALAGAVQPIDCFAIRGALIASGLNDAAKFAITDDIHAVMAAAGRDTGIVAKISSGVCVLAKKSQEEYFIMGGRDSELSDAGSGYWVGLRVLQLLLDFGDRRLPRDKEFRTAMLDQLQLTDELQITPWYYETKKTRQWKHRISDLTIPLSELTNNKNPTALKLLKLSAQEIAQTIRAAVERAAELKYVDAEPIPVVVAGNYWRHCTYLRSCVGREFSGQKNIRFENAPHHTFLGALSFAVAKSMTIPSRDVWQQLAKSMSLELAQ